MLFVISAFSLDAIPRSHPEELNNISLLDRLNQMEQCMSNMQTSIDNLVAQNLMLQDQVKDVTSYAAKVKSPATNSIVCSQYSDIQNKNSVPESAISDEASTDVDGF